MKNIETNYSGGISSPLGFKAVGVEAAIKSGGGLDLALVFSEQPAVAAGAFTANKLAAAPVLYDREILEQHGYVRGIFVNSGCANACTGSQGDADTSRIAALTAQALGVEDREVLVCSTGRIGTCLPINNIESAMKNAVDSLSEDGGRDAAEAILTTDTRPKSISVTVNLSEGPVTIGGMCKGAGMIAPAMKPAVPHATMLAFMTTDADVDRDFLDQCLAASLDSSFNRITVDGDSSTNDSFIALANGAAGNSTLDARHKDADIFQEAFTYVATWLAKQIVLDGEGATKFVEVKVSRAASEEEACDCAAAIANSLLCKTAWFGADPNWGRIVDAAGYSGAKINKDNLQLYLQGVAAVQNGIAADTSEQALKDAVSGDEVKIELELGAGESEYTMWTCDLSYEYVNINAEYHT